MPNTHQCLNFAGIYHAQEREDEGMEQRDQFMKKNRPKSFSKGFFRFIEKSFDWIALVVIALIILFALAFFNV